MNNFFSLLMITVSRCLLSVPFIFLGKTSQDGGLERDHQSKKWYSGTQGCNEGKKKLLK